MIDLKAEAESIRNLHSAEADCGGDGLVLAIRNLCTRYANEKVEAAAMAVEGVMPIGSDDCVLCEKLRQAAETIRATKEEEGRDG